MTSAFKLIIIAVTCIAALSLTLISSHADSCPQPRHDSGQTAYNPDAAHSTTNGEELWRYTDPGDVSTADHDLVAVGDAVIVNQGNRIFVLNAADKSYRWGVDVESIINPCGAVIDTFVATDGADG